MKKFYCIIISLLLAALAGCSSQTKPEQTTATSTQASTAEKSKTVRYKGIDVSSYSGDIDWKAVKKQGISFAMIRLGGRGFGGKGSLYMDKNARKNLDSARKYGIKVGGYFFSQALTRKEAKQEAKYAARILKDRKLDLPIAYDLEKLADTRTRVENLEYKDGFENALAFMDTVIKLGYEAAVYIEKDGFLSAADFDSSQVWYADFGKPYENSYLMFQYSKEGKVDGISGSVDLNVMYK